MSSTGQGARILQIARDLRTLGCEVIHVTVGEAASVRASVTTIFSSGHEAVCPLRRF